MKEMRNAQGILVEKPEDERPLGRTRRIWEDSIKVDINETRCENVDWIHLAHDRDQYRDLVNTVMNLRIP
jgi:hypothetical protein